MNFRTQTDRKPVIRAEWYPRLADDNLYLPCLMRFKRNLSPEELRQATATVTVMATTMVMATEMETATVTVMAMTSHGLRISPTEICHSDLVAIPYSLGLPSSEMNLVKDIKKTKLFKHCNLNELLKYVEFKEV